MLNHITPVILTFNEQANLHRTLKALAWAKKVIVIDSFSNDNTLRICQKYPNVKVVQHAFSSHAEQSNFALTQVKNSAWVLSMDADYIVTPELKTELASLSEQTPLNGFRINFQYAIRGKVLKGSLYPARTCLYKKEHAHYIQDGHTQRVIVNGEVGTLNEVLLHDDRKPYSRWLSSQSSYAKKEAEKMAKLTWREMSWPDRIRFLGLAPIVIIPYTLLFKKLLFNGLAGLEYCVQRVVAELYLLRARLFHFIKSRNQ